MDIDNQQNSTKEIFFYAIHFIWSWGSAFALVIYSFYLLMYIISTETLELFISIFQRTISDAFFARISNIVRRRYDPGVVSMCPHDSSCSAHFMLSTCLMNVGDQISEIQISTCWSVLVTKPGLDSVDILKYIKCSVIHQLSVVKHLRYNEVKTP